MSNANSYQVGGSHYKREYQYKKYGIMNRPRSAYRNQRARANRQGIPFLLAYEQWYDIWKKSGVMDQRGPAGYVMSRKGDKGPYAVGNVEIILQRDNIAARRFSKRARKKISENTRKCQENGGHCAGLVWITDGKVSRRISVGEVVPRGWSRGKTDRRSK